jgi:hypothetical protein
MNENIRIDEEVEAIEAKEEKKNSGFWKKARKVAVVAGVAILGVLVGKSMSKSKSNDSDANCVETDFEEVND